MIVRDDGEAWHVVLQTDHADLSAELARAWGGHGFAPPEPFDPVVTAAARHDDGWAVWERAPTLTADGRPTNFLEVDVRSHVAFYRAAIEAVSEQDRYAGLLVSMHGTGIYRGRYGIDHELRLELEGEEAEAVAAFVEDQEERQEALRHELGIDEDRRWANYRLLQVYDRLSLHLCLAPPGARQRQRIERAPREPGGEEVDLSVTPDGEGRARIGPYPFADDPARFTLRRRRLAKREWANVESFRDELFATPLESLAITLEPL